MTNDAMQSQPHRSVPGLNTLQAILDEDNHLTLSDGRALLAHAIAILHPLLSQPEASPIGQQIGEYWKALRAIQQNLEQQRMLSHADASRLFSIIRDAETITATLQNEAS